MDRVILSKFVTVFVLTFISEVVGENLYSASVQWIPIDQHKILFTYHLSWRQTKIKSCPFPNTSPECEHYLNGSYPVKSDTLGKWKGDYRWMCDSGCHVHGREMVANMSGLYYKNISTIQNIPWESAAETTEIALNRSNLPQEIILRLYRPDGTAVAGIEPVHINMGVRQDTNRTNIGPVVTVLPFYRVPLGQIFHLSVFPYDGDGDKVRCKWGTNATTSSIGLFEDTCNVTVNTQTVGEFRVQQEIQLSLYAEDYSCTPVQFGGKKGDLRTGPFSKVPFMVTIIISSAIATNSIIPQYRQSSLTNQNQVTLLRLPIINFKTEFKFHEGDVRHFLSNGPRFMKFRSNTETNTVESTWNMHTSASMTGIHQACVMLYDGNGVPHTETKCVILFIGAVDQCRSSPCQDRGLCKSWYNYRTCVSTHDTDICPTDTDEYDFLKQYIRYMIYAGAGVFGLLSLLLLWCFCLNCCCGNKKKNPKWAKPVKIRERCQDSH